MPRICRVGDAGSHGGAILSGSPNVFDNGDAVARIGDIYGCPIHGPNPLVSWSPNVYCDDRQVVRVGDKAECGAVMVSGSPTTWANENG